MIQSNIEILYEDNELLIFNKPSGMSVHNDETNKNVLELLNPLYERPLHLIHRLDRETSGVLMLAKKRSALVALHEAIRNNQTDKRYVMLVQGVWLEQKKRVVLELQKYLLPKKPISR